MYLWWAIPLWPKKNNNCLDFLICTFFRALLLLLFTVGSGILTSRCICRSTKSLPAFFHALQRKMHHHFSSCFNTFSTILVHTFCMSNCPITLLCTDDFEKVNSLVIIQKLFGPPFITALNTRSTFSSFMCGGRATDTRIVLHTHSVIFETLNPLRAGSHLVILSRGYIASSGGDWRMQSMQLHTGAEGSCWTRGAKVFSWNLTFFKTNILK